MRGIMIASGVEGDPRCMQLCMCGSPGLPDQAILPAMKSPKLRLQKQIRTQGGCRATQMKRGLTVPALASSHHCLGRFGDSVDGSQCRSALILGLSDAN